jgi:voltage-gated potassium channel
MSRRAVIASTAEGVLASPLRNLIGTLVYVLVVFLAAIVGFMAAGWSFGDALYMVTLTIFSVGYGEVHPIDTNYLHALTIATMVLGCTGMIVLTGALVQVFTLFQFRRMLGIDRMLTQIERLDKHVIICGFGRIGVQLAKELHAAERGFVIVERDAAKIAQARTLGFLCVSATATEESALQDAGIERARVLATVLPNDAANVFITLSARNMNADVEIIARGEAPTTETKLFHAGASKVVLPTHIGAERIAEMILYPTTDRFMEDAPELREMKRGLHDFGLELEVVTIAAGSALVNETVQEAERRGRGAFFIVQIDRASGQSIQHPGEDAKLEMGDSVVIVVRGSKVAAGVVFSAPADRIKVGRSRF